MFSQHSPHPKRNQINFFFPTPLGFSLPEVQQCLPNAAWQHPTFPQHWPVFFLMSPQSIARHPLAIFNTPINSWHFPNILSMPNFFWPLNVSSMVTYCQKNCPLMFSWHCSKSPASPQHYLISLSFLQHPPIIENNFFFLHPLLSSHHPLNLTRHLGTFIKMTKLHQGHPLGSRDVPKKKMLATLVIWVVGFFNKTLVSYAIS